MKLESGQFIDHSRKLLKVSGLDAKKFLQGIITNDINKSFSSLIYSGLLSPQGKYLFDFFINGLDEENFIIDIDTDSYKDFLNRLNLYKLRSNVLFSDIESSVILGFGDKINDSFYDPRSHMLGWRKFSFQTLDKNKNNDEDTFFKKYELKRIDLCIPKSGYELKSGETYILETNFDKINGVSFTKGCFVGQEVTARMRHKTTLKNGIIKFQSTTDELKLNNIITNEDGKKVGRISSFLNKKGLAVIKFIYARGKLYCEENEIKILYDN